jgi:hypothetical protein
LFNISDNPEAMEISVNLSDLGINKKCKVRDIWTGKSLGKVDKKISVSLSAHACKLFVFKQ